jgi:lactoylglutathione lyase
MRIHYAMVFVSDMAQSVAFYRDAVGLPLRFESPGWSEFATEGATLALHLAEGTGPGASPRPPHAGSSRPGLQVPDLGAFHQRMLARGVRCVQEPTAVFGARVAQYLDPDGLILAVGEERAR